MDYSLRGKYSKNIHTTDNDDKLYEYLYVKCFSTTSAYNIDEIETYIKNHKHLINIQNNFEHSIIIQTILVDKCDILALFIKYGADLNLQYGSNKYTPLMYAIYKNSYKCVSMLIQHTRNLETRDVNGNTALLKVMFYIPKDLRFKFIGELIRRGANIYAQNNKEQNILYFAIINNDDVTLGLLIKNKMDLNVLNSKKQNILHQTILDYNFSSKTLMLLIKNGVKFDEKDNDGKTIYDILIYEIMKYDINFYLTKHGDNVINFSGYTLKFMEFIQYCKFFDLLVILFELGASFCINNTILDKLLITAINNRNIKYTRILFEHGAKISGNHIILHELIPDCLARNDFAYLKLFFKYGVNLCIPPEIMEKLQAEMCKY